MANKKDIKLLHTRELEDNYYDAEVRLGIKGQKQLTPQQLFTIERLFKNWNNPLIKIAVMIIKKTKL